MATSIALGIGAAAAAASAGVSIAGAVNAKGALRQKAPGGAGARRPLLKLFNQETQGLLDQERSLLEDAAGQGRALLPDAYKALGYEPVYDTPTDPAALAASSQKVKDTTAASIAARKAVLTAKRAGKAGPKRMLALNRAVTDADTAMSAAKTEFGQLSTVGSKIISLNKVQPSDPTNSPNDLFRMALDLDNQTLIRALKGEAPIDSTLQHNYQVGETQLRERLRRQLGPDYETSTAGSQALASFQREKGDAFEAFNRDTIKTFSTLSEGRAAALSNLTAAQISQMFTPINAQLGIADALMKSADARNAYVNMNDSARLGAAGKNIAAYQAASERGTLGLQANAQQITAASNGLNSLAGGLNAAAPALDRYLNPPTTTTAPQTSSSLDYGFSQQPTNYSTQSPNYLAGLV